MKPLAPLLLLLPLASGCTAVKATYHLVEAQQAVSRAENHRAPELAVYEYTMATRFLEKAQEEAGYSDYKVAVDLARRSAEWADRSIIAIESEGRDLDLAGYTTMTDDALPEAAAPTDDDLAEPLPTVEGTTEDEALWRELEEDTETETEPAPEPEPQPAAPDPEPQPAEPEPEPEPAEPSFEVPAPEGNPWEGQ